MHTRFLCPFYHLCAEIVAAQWALSMLYVVALHFLGDDRVILDFPLPVFIDQIEQYAAQAPVV